MTLLHYATYFDRHYLPQGLALYRSLVRHSPPFVLWVLCMDEQVERTLTAMDLEHLRLVSLAELEQANPALLAVKPARLPVEYYWTCGPAFLVHLFERETHIRMITYLDADLFFFSDPTLIYEELGTHSILIVEGRRGPSVAGSSDKQLGRFNVGLLVFRATAAGLACVRRWREQCLEWCFDRLEEHRFGDQAYLDDWPDRFDGVTVLQHQGGGVTPANILSLPVTYEQGNVSIGGARLVFYHFSGMRRINRWTYEMHNWRFHRQAVGRVVREHIYGPYIRELQAGERAIRKTGDRSCPSPLDHSVATVARWRREADTDGGTALVRCRRHIVVVGSFVL